jgi:hypothetical protein
MSDLATSRYADFTSAMGVPVQTSIGRPRWPLSYELTESAKRLMPWGLLGKDISEDDFTAHYRARLDKVGVDVLAATFEAISKRHDGARLVLLCFEPQGQFCHRRLFAAWWTEQTNQDVPELDVCHDHRDNQGREQA